MFVLHLYSVNLCNWKLKACAGCKIKQDCLAYNETNIAPRNQTIGFFSSLYSLFFYFSASLCFKRLTCYYVHKYSVKYVMKFLLVLLQQHYNNRHKHNDLQNIIYISYIMSGESHSIVYMLCDALLGAIRQWLL